MVLVATIGIVGLAQAISIEIPEPSDASAHYPSAINGGWTVAGVSVRGADVAILILVPVAILLLMWFLDRTLIGKTVKACATNPSLARLSAISPKMVSTMVWALAAVLSTLSVILIAGESSTAAGLATLGPQTLSEALAAAVIAGMRSFRVAVIAAVAIAVIQSVLTFNFLAVPGITDLLLFIAVFVAVIFAKREGGEEQAFAFSPRANPIPERLRSIWWARNIDKGGILLLGVVALLLPIVVTYPSRVQLYTAVLAFAICASSLTVLTGWLGQLSLGQMAFAGLAALFGARLVTEGVPFWLAVPTAMVGSALFALGIGIGSLRVRGLYLAVVTFVFALTAQQYFYFLPFFSGESPDGANVPYPPGKLWFLNFPGQRTYYYVVLVILALVIVVLSRFRDSGVGRRIKAVRDNEIGRGGVHRALGAGEAAGLHVGRWPRRAGWFTPRRRLRQHRLHPELLSGQRFPEPGRHGGHRRHGLGLRRGYRRNLRHRDPLPCAQQCAARPAEFEPRFAHRPALLPARPEPDHLRGPRRRSWPGPTDGWGTVRRPSDRSIRPGCDVRPRTPLLLPGPVLAVSDLSVHYGGIAAVDNATLHVNGGEIVGLIGANGAGKSTLMNAIGGFVTATGSITLLGEEVAGKSPGYRASLGLGRTFQSATLFPELTVNETLLVALEAKGHSGMLSTALGLPRARRHNRAAQAEVSELIGFLGLDRYRDHYVSDLSTGTRRVVELAGLLALNAKVLCLDEPTAGLAQRETEAFGPLIATIRKELAASVLLIEHDMPLIMGISERVYCFETGQVIAEGAPAAVRRRPARHRKLPRHGRAGHHVGAATTQSPSHVAGPSSDRLRSSLRPTADASA